MKKGFKRHFRIYLVNNHPAYIVDEAGNKYFFHSVTSSKKSCGRNNFKITPNPLYSGKDEMYIVKRIEKDKVNRLLNELILKRYVQRLGQGRATKYQKI